MYLRWLVSVSANNQSICEEIWRCFQTDCNPSRNRRLAEIHAGVDDEGNTFELAPDPMNEELQEQFKDIVVEQT